MAIDPTNSGAGVAADTQVTPIQAKLAIDTKKFHAAMLKQFEKDVGNAIQDMQSKLKASSDELKKSTGEA